MAVDSSYKGKGIATKLMKYGESKLSKMGEKRVRLTVAKTHPYLPQMYAEKGYEIVGERLFQDFLMTKLLWKNYCSPCHSLTNIPTLWLRNSSFSIYVGLIESFN